MSHFCLEDGATVVFIGDSITDCGRRVEAPPLGTGYVSLFAELTTAYYPERQYRFINVGIGGDTIPGLRSRWPEDVLAHQPDWLSVKIGINDLHRYLNGEEAFSPERYRENYEAILTATVEQTSARLILIDPFYICRPGEGDPFQEKVLATLPEYLQVVEEMAQRYDALHVRTHEMFARHLQFRSPATFCPEPVHPYRLGHTLIAVELLRTLRGG